MGECAAKVDFGPASGTRPVALLRAVVKPVPGCYPRSPVSSPERVEADIVGSGSRPGDGSQAAGTDDADLVASMARGDAAALGALYDRHAPQMLALAKRIVVTATAAEDIVQDVFLEAWKKARSYDPGRGGVKSWLLLRTRSRCIDFRRAANQSRASSVGDDFWAEHATAPVSDVSSVPDHGAIRRALSDLPKDQREALWLGYFEGLSSSEIASKLGCPVGTIKTRVAAALSKLRTALADPAGETS
jgi:RNA polymerase sigma-70 factor (ECF subfamily)